VPKSMQEYIDASTAVLSELWDTEVAAEQINAITKRDFTGWSEEERNELLLLAAHVAFENVQILADAVGKWRAEALATGRALNKFIGQDVEKRARMRRKAIINKYLRPEGDESL
jgi:hypothetical protein